MPVRSPRSSWRASSNLKYSPPSSVMCTRPSTYIASSVTKMPKLVAALTTPLYSSPRCSRMGFAGCRQGWQRVLRLAQNGLDDPVHQQVGVAPDRAGEMRVGIERQAKVTTVDGRVDGLLHGAQQHGVDLLSVGPVLGCRGDGLEVTGFRVVADRHAHGHGLEVVAQDFLLLGRGALVHTEQAGLSALGDKVSAAHVGGQHGLFDEFVCIVAGARHDLFNAAVFVADDLCFGGLEVHSAARLARDEQRTVHVMQVEQVLDAVLALAGFRAARIGQDGCDLGVREARVAEHNGRVELVRMHLALGGDQHVADHAQALHLGVERAEPVAELLGQHGDHAARKVHAGGTVVGIDVDGAARFHIVAHVGNRHQQTPALAAANLGGLAVHGIVEVARIFAVDGDQGHVGQVHATLLVLRAHLVGELFGLCEALGRELVWHTVLAHGDFDLHAGVIDLAKHFGDTPHRLAEQGWRFCQLNPHDLPGLRGARGAFGDQYILTVALVFGGHEPHAAFLQQSADDRLGRTLNDFHDTPFGAATAVLADDAHAHTVLVQDCAHFVRGDIDVAFAIVTDDKTVSITVPLHAAFNLVRQMRGLRAGGGFFDIQS